MEEMYKEFCMDIFGKLKDSVNASIHCAINDETDCLTVDISRLGINYTTTIKDCSSIIQNGEDGIDKCVSKIIKSYRNWINHKFFY